MCPPPQPKGNSPLVRNVVFKKEFVGDLSLIVPIHPSPLLPSLLHHSSKEMHLSIEKLSYSQI